MSKFLKQEFLSLSSNKKPQIMGFNFTALLP